MTNSRYEKYPGDERTYEKLEYNAKSKHWIMGCTAQVPTQDGDSFRCAFKKRDDHLKKEISNGKLHECFPDSAKQKDIRNFILSTESQMEGSVEFNADGIFRRLAILLAKHNISLSTGESDEIYNLIVYSFCLGYTTSKENGKTAIQVGMEKIPHYKRDKLKDILIQTSKEIHSSIMARFSTFSMPYASVALDEGTTQKRSLLDFVLENPCFPIQSYPAHTERMTGLKTANYTLAINNGLKAIHDCHVQIGCVIVDGGTAQLAALTGKDNSILALSKVQWMKEIIVVPCICHRVHNAYKAAMNHPAISPLKDQLLEVAEICRQHVEVFGSRCPSNVETRWVSFIYPLHFIWTKRAKVTLFHSIPDGTEDLYKCSVIFASLVLIFEDPKSPLSRVYPCIYNAMKALEELDAENNRFARIFRDILLEKTIHSQMGGLWAFAYIITPKGLMFARNSINSREFPPPTSGYVKMFHYRQKEEDPIEDVREIFMGDAAAEAEGNTEPPAPSLKHNWPAQDLNRFNEDLHEQEEVHESNDDTEGEELCDSPMVDAAISWFTSELKKRGRSDDVIDDIVKLFKDMIANNNHIFKTSRTVSGLDIFDFNFKINDENWGLFANICLRITCCTCAEASCERTISAQRLILTCSNLNMSKELMDARLKIMKGASWQT